jgi:predicted RND superfamily exporter protein
MKRSFRNANFGLATSVVVLIVGTLLFYSSEGAIEALALLALVAAFGVFFFFGVA